MAKLHNARRVVFCATLMFILFSVSSPPSTRGLPYHFVNMQFMEKDFSEVQAVMITIWQNWQQHSYNTNRGLYRVKNNRGDCLSGARPLITSLHLTLTGLITGNSSNNKIIRVLLLHFISKDALWANQVRFCTNQSCALLHSLKGYITVIVQLSGIYGNVNKPRPRAVTIGLSGLLP